MTNVMSMIRGAKLAAVIVAALAISGCAKNALDQQAGGAGGGPPGSPQDFVVNELFDGLKSLRGLLLVEKLLFRPRLTVVPVRNPLLMLKFVRSCRVINALFPVTNALLCGCVRWPQLAPALIIGSRLGIAGPPA